MAAYVRQMQVGMLIALRVLFTLGMLIWVGLVLKNIISSTTQVVRTRMALDIEGIPQTWLTTLLFLAFQALLVPICIYLALWGNRRLSRMVQAWRCPGGARSSPGE